MYDHCIIIQWNDDKDKTLYLWSTKGTEHFQGGGGWGVVLLSYAKRNKTLFLSLS